MRKCSIWKPDPNNKTFPTRMPQWRDSRKKYNIKGDIRTLLGKEREVEKMMRFLREIRAFQGDIRTLLGKDCEVEKMMRFLRKIGIFKEI